MAGRGGPLAPLPRLTVAADFERVLGLRSRAATPHFAVHHLNASPMAPRRSSAGASRAKLSTIEAAIGPLPVEELSATPTSPPLAWVGAVVPKRHARRAVTRSLIKRQIYAASERHRGRMAPGLWIVRLRSPFDRAQFVSAASTALRRLARAELDALFAAAAASS